jgi:predicted permease
LTPDWRVLGFATGLALLTCLLFGLTPAIRATRIELGRAMNATGRGLTAGGERFNLRRALVVAQVALSLVLVAGGLLFSRSLAKLMTVDAGFRQEGVLTALVMFQRLNLPPDRVPAFRDELLDQIRAIPGIESAALAHEVPLRSRGGSNVWVEGQNSSQGKGTNLSRVSPDYFKTLQIQLLAGRDFDARDGATAPKVVIVNEAFMREFFNGANPVGRRLWIEQTVFAPETPYEIVGLARDTKYGDLREEFMPIVYHAAAQVRGTGPGGQLLIRSRLSPSETVAAVKQVLNDLNPAIAVDFQWFKSMIDATILRERLMATLSGFFGALAFLLACIGLYGLLSYGVATRSKEIGIRMALGADRRDVFWLVLREAILLVMVGVVVGLPLIFGVTRLASSLLFGLTPTDPVSIVVAAVVMMAVALVAGYLPSRRATRVDPMVTLRAE